MIAGRGEGKMRKISIVPKRSWWPWLTVIAALALVGPVEGPVYGSKKKPEADKHGASEPAEPEMEFKGETGEPLTQEDLEAIDATLAEFSSRETQKIADELAENQLRGFDLTLLRSADRVDAWRHEIRVIGSSNSEEKLTCVLEFGAEIGVVETKYRNKEFRPLIEDLVMQFTFEELLSVAGKMSLKEKILRVVNSRLTTAKARQVYFTHFRLRSPE